jgi:uncharacterized membrane protein YagU involved in acid resistance
VIVTYTPERPLWLLCVEAAAYGVVAGLILKGWGYELPPRRPHPRSSDCRPFGDNVRS